MSIFDGPRRVRPVPHFSRLYLAERRHIRRRLWTSPRLLRIEADWATRYVVQGLALCWLAWAPALLLWGRLISNGFHLDYPIVVEPRAALPMYAFAGLVASLFYAWWRPYISYVELQVRRHMDDWYRTVCEAERSGRLY
ncbi:hypothetical protein E2P84_43920 [Burkholderia cepacia]|jgi:hypothetical protein|uniref:Poly-beta-1,6-N-acetyl-D-glucosamine biosynthesis protein PgaD n=1 Tax=Burkholderia cepacia TaxID=292 RepID=A0AAX2RIJ3_BURCE|nr:MULTISPECIES: hypothetical protein [Burkholderia]HDR9056882.1 hypothetical protein [Burkholderia vietnamiensis]ABK13549.1 hypothetical protein Bcen2424_6820 [Burkholderia cenocepacia HI2424]MCF1371754.1 hypothetical protein [Burkholderia cenocepacia]MCF1389133.1 hypothetical protein [Burkholderia cenocepacia]MCG0577185.1 hypothetical protein [Burkholderia cenocepacia]